MAGCGTTGMADCPPPYYGPSQAQRFNPPPNSYVVNSKIMVVAVAVLFAVVMFILCLHVYAKWFWRNQGALGATDGTLRTVSWRRRRRVLDPNQNSPLVVATQQSAGLEKSVIAALPVFEVDAKMLSESALECAVCLEEFEEGEKGRTLPKCGHHFHIECVDMWLHSHSTCPLCRASVRPDDDSKTSAAATTTTTNDIEAQTEAGPVIGDVHAPFMAAMRASRRRQRSLGRPSPPESVPTENAAPTESSPPSQEEPTTSGGPKALALEYESIPSNVLFWGNSNSGGQPSASGIPSQVTIDIPPAGTGAAGSSSTAMSPMARASANFRRLLSRGKSVVSPQDAADEGGPSSPHPPPPPSPPSNAA